MLLAAAAYEQPLKWFAVGLGICSTLCVVQGWQLPAMALSLPFCLIWIYFGWLRSERQLQYINMIFAAFYIYGTIPPFHHGGIVPPANSTTKEPVI